MVSETNTSLPPAHTPPTPTTTRQSLISETTNSLPPYPTTLTHTQQSMISETDTSSVRILPSLNCTTETNPTMSTLLSELHPRKYKRAMEIESEWCDTNQKKIVTKHHHQQTKSLTQVLQVLSDKNPSFASDLIQTVRDANPILDAELSKKKDKSGDINDKIVNSIKSFFTAKVSKGEKKGRKGSIQCRASGMHSHAVRFK